MSHPCVSHIHFFHECGHLFIIHGNNPACDGKHLYSHVLDDMQQTIVADHISPKCPYLKDHNEDTTRSWPVAQIADVKDARDYLCCSCELVKDKPGFHHDLPKHSKQAIQDRIIAWFFFLDHYCGPVRYENILSRRAERREEWYRDYRAYLDSPDRQNDPLPMVFVYEHADPSETRLLTILDRTAIHHDATCRICKEKLIASEVARLPCGFLGHDDCLRNRWLNTEHNRYRLYIHCPDPRCLQATLVIRPESWDDPVVVDLGDHPPWIRKEHDVGSRVHVYGYVPFHYQRALAEWEPVPGSENDDRRRMKPVYLNMKRWEDGEVVMYHRYTPAWFETIAKDHLTAEQRRKYGGDRRPL